MTGTDNNIVRQKTILRKNKRGNIVKIVREQYLRDDIHCGHMQCHLCSALELTAAQTPLSHMPKLSVTGKPAYFLPDSTIPIHQMDILEHLAVADMIITGTVLDEVRDRGSLPLYTRLRALASDKSRRFFVFSNEFHKDTFVERLSGELLAKRNHRAICQAALWYRRHLQKSLGAEVDTVILSNNSDMIQLASGYGLKALTMPQYAELLKDEAPELMDMVASTDDEESAEQGKKTTPYSEYLSTSELQRGLKSGRFFQGKLAISTHNLFEGSIFAPIDGHDRTVKIQDRQYLNRAVHEDIVVIELLPKSEWAQLEKRTVIEEDETEETESTTAPSTKAEMDLDAEPVFDTPYGKVVGVLKRNWRTYAGAIDTERLAVATGTQIQSVWFYPVDRRIPRIRIKTRQLQYLAKKKILVSIDGWSKTEMNPRGHFVRVLGEIGEKATEMESLLLEHDVPFQAFVPEIMEELPREGDKWIVRDEHLVGREDFRNLNICSIDPPGCTDIDDALHCRLLENRNYECGVHIADVTHFVKSTMKMDQEAARRGTTVYLVDKRIDMLPSLLGTNLCSLRENVDRLAFSVIWELDAKAEIQNIRFAKSVIRSCASLTYSEAQARIDDKNKNDELTLSIRNLNKLAKVLRQGRLDKGSIVLSSPEVRFKLEHETQDPVDLELKEHTETNALVEEFMLLANISVAREIFRKFPEVAVLRRHPKPEVTNFEALNKQLAHYGIHLGVSSSKELADSLDKASVSSDKYFNNLVRILTTRCMMQAKYFCSGSFAYEDFWHYGLATDIYTHFTSPIRRYADVMVHRLLHACIDPGQVIALPHIFDRAKISEICDNINFRHHMAQQASRSSVELYTNLFFKGKIVVEDGYVIRVLKNGVGVLIPKFGIEGFVYSTSNADEESLLKFNADTFTLTYQQVCLRVFSRVKVRITIDDTGVAGLRQRLRMHFVEPRIPNLSVDI